MSFDTPVRLVARRMALAAQAGIGERRHHARASNRLLSLGIRCVAGGAVAAVYTANDSLEYLGV